MQYNLSVILLRKLSISDFNTLLRHAVNGDFAPLHDSNKIKVPVAIFPKSSTAQIYRVVVLTTWRRQP